MADEMVKILADDSASRFQDDCDKLVKDGYKLFKADCSCDYSTPCDVNVSFYNAIFIKPEVLARRT